MTDKNTGTLKTPCDDCADAYRDFRSGASWEHHRDGVTVTKWFNAEHMICRIKLVEADRS